MWSLLLTQSFINSYELFYVLIFLYLSSEISIFYCDFVRSSDERILSYVVDYVFLNLALLFVAYL